MIWKIRSTSHQMVCFTLMLMIPLLGGSKLKELALFLVEFAVGRYLDELPRKKVPEGMDPRWHPEWDLDLSWIMIRALLG
jgi:hypothetical protein